MERVERLSAVLLALVPGVLACSERQIDLDQFTDNLCDERLQALQAVEPAMPVDAMQLRETVKSGDDGSFLPPTVLDADGELCGGANDRAACEAALAEISPVTEFVPGSDYDTYYRGLLYTRGDEAAGVAELGGLRTFLGEIDAPGDAALWAYLSYAQIVCDEENDVGPHGDGFVVHTRTGGACGPGDDIEEHVVLVRSDGTLQTLQTVLVQKTDPGCAVGRMPGGACRWQRARSRGAVGALLADIAGLEAAAVAAFGELAVELRHHGAPAALVAASVRARHDEIRHAGTMAALARRYGAHASAPRVRAMPPRPLETLARDNAIEGCVRETFGAAVAHVQARQARDPMVRRVFASIARDETRHAALSWSLAAWAEARMGARARQRIARDRAEAVARLRGELVRGHGPAAHVELGMPTQAQAQRLFDGLDAALWRA